MGMMMFCHDEKVIAPKLIKCDQFIIFKPYYSSAMMSRQTISFILIFCAVSVAKGQEFSNLRSFYDEFRRSKYEQSFNEKKDINGSPWEKPEFVPGEIYTSGNKHYSGIPLRYNIYSNQIEFRKPEGGIFEIDPPEIIDSLFIGESYYIFYPYVAGSKTQKSYFKVLTKGSPMLLLRMNVILKEAEPPGAYKEAVPASFVRMQDDFYLAAYPSDANKFSGKKELLELLGSHKEELELFIKQNKLKFNRQDDMIKLLKFYYTLK
jgi:hypothetical protein